jgi:integration host factor subunit beta
MTKRELVRALQERLPLLHEHERVLLVDEMIAALMAALVAGQRVEIRGFGVFEIRQRGPRVARNPRTGRTMSIPAKRVPFFRAGKTLLDRVNAAADENHR